VPVLGHRVLDVGAHGANTSPGRSGRGGAAPASGPGRPSSSAASRQNVSSSAFRGSFLRVQATARSKKPRARTFSSRCHRNRSTHRKRGQALLGAAAVLLEVARNQGLDGSAVVFIDIPAGDELFGQRPALLERPRLKRGDQPRLVDDSNLERQKSEQ
jgi:hypothetical protein